MDCAATAKKAKVTIQALNLTAAKRDEAKQTSGVTGIANFIGDRIQLQGSFTLQGSPYGTHVSGGNSLKVQNLFIDWGDGSACSPVLVKVQGGGSFTKDSVLVLQSAIWGTHDYESEGNFSIRLFQLAEDDIQLPLGDFFAALGSAVSPQPAGKNTYKTVLDAGQGPSAQAKAAESEPDPLAAALPRAYLIFCHNIKISHYRDSCAAGPIQLTSLEILNFPGHDVIMPGKSSRAAEGGVNINLNMAALYNGIHAVAVTCDKALIARARLRYFGKGSVEVTWYVDSQAVQAETFALASNDRGNLSPDQAADCSQPLSNGLGFHFSAFFRGRPRQAHRPDQGPHRPELQGRQHDQGGGEGRLESRGQKSEPRFDGGGIGAGGLDERGRGTPRGYVRPLVGPARRGGKEGPRRPADRDPFAGGRNERQARRRLCQRRPQEL